MIRRHLKIWVGPVDAYGAPWHAYDIQDLAGLFPKLDRLHLDCIDAALSTCISNLQREDTTSHTDLLNLSHLEMEFDDYPGWNETSVDGLLNSCRTIHAANITLRFKLCTCPEGPRGPLAHPEASAVATSTSVLRSLHLVAADNADCDSVVPFWVSLPLSGS
jgi:hypothetical protein